MYDPEMTPGRLIALAIAGLAVLSPSPAVPAAVAGTAPPRSSDPIRVEFDYSAAERMAEAIDRPALSEAEAKALLENRGIAAMVTKTGVFSPGSTPQDRELIEKTLKQDHVMTRLRTAIPAGSQRGS